jgi:hypothetical protein
VDEAKNQSVVATYASQAGAEAANSMLRAAGIATTCLSIGVKGSQPERRAAGIDASRGIRLLGGRGAIWGAVWASEIASASQQLKESS